MTDLDPFVKVKWLKNKYYDPETRKWVEPPIAFTNIISVGMPSDNTVLDRTWGHWAAKPDASGFRIFGSDDYPPGDVGYIESDRNYYSLHVKDYPFKQNIKLTGSSPIGVQLATQSFLKNSILNGVITKDPRQKDEWNLWTIGRKQHVSQLPSWIPSGSYARGTGTLACLGWSMPCSLIYSQFLQIGKTEPSRIWKVKYVTNKGIHDFESGLHRRASGNELLVIEFADDTKASEATKHIATWLYGSWWKQLDVFGLKTLRAEQAPDTYLHLLCRTAAVHPSDDRQIAR